jgi:transcriptional regulator with XRE-family HTH domain
MFSMSLDNQSKKVLKRLGLRLRSIRNDKGWTLEQTEEHGWTSWRHLQKIEAGKNITVVTLIKLARLYKLPLAEIFKDI